MTTTPGHPYPGFLFEVRLVQAGGGTPLCSARFAECSGLEANMEPKSIREGGRNWGQVQRVGHVDFATVVLRRGMTRSRDLWTWFSYTTLKGKHALRMGAEIAMLDFADAAQPHRPVVTWTLAAAMPVKFKVGDLNAQTSQIAIEELHFVHEGLDLKAGS